MSVSAPKTLLHRPTTQDELLDVLAEHGDAAKVVAGGTAFTILWKAGLLRPEHLVSAMAVSGLGELAAGERQVSIGALCRLRDVERDGGVRRCHPVLAGTLRLVANARVRNVATMGGNVAEADPTSDPPCVLTALDAVVHVASREGRRAIPFREFVSDYFETVLHPEEVVTHVNVPTLAPDWSGTYLKFLSRSAEDRTCLGVAAFVRDDGAGTCAGLRVSVVGATPVPLRLRDVEAQVVGRMLDDACLAEVAAQYVAASDPISDVRGSADYRRRVLAPLVVRAVRRAARGTHDAVLA
jgi:carbon-monoxide dehydrogenase medium subunit